MTRKVGIIGSGGVGTVLANGFLKYGYSVMRGSRDPKKLGDWAATAGSSASTGTFEEAAKFGDLVVFAVKGHAAEDVLALCTPAALAGKVVLDATNPIADAPPENGVLRFFTGPNESLMERLQAKAPDAHFVKAFSCVGAGLMVNPEIGGTKPTMFICGNNAGAKSTTTEILTQFGWETNDMGMATSARAIEPLCMLWCIPGMLHNDWSHAFKMLKK